MNSFDVFDTLIGRRFVTSDIIWEQIQHEFQHENFVINRLGADNGKRSLEEIYEAFGGTDAEMAREIELEIQNAFPVYQNIQKVKDGDVLISDMYLPAWAIMMMLRNAGFDKQVTIYQSNGDKANGKVWEMIKPDLHLGDNMHSDVTMPRNAGIQAEHYEGTGLNVAETNLVSKNFNILAMMMREVRLRHDMTFNEKINDIARNYNLPFLFCFAELVKRRKKPQQNIVFLGRDTYLLYKIFHEYYGPCTYLPFSRALAFKTPSDAVTYLNTQSPPNALYVDLSSTGATWQHLSRWARFEVLVGIYSDVFHYTNTKPKFPNGFQYLVKNSDIGNTNYLLEVFNCAKHGHIKGFDKYKATFGDPELGLTTIIDIYDPIESAIKLSEYYRISIKIELESKDDYELSRLFGEMAISISGQAGYMDEFTDYLNKEKTYLENL